MGSRIFDLTSDSSIKTMKQIFMLVILWVVACQSGMSHNLRSRYRSAFNPFVGPIPPPAALDHNIRIASAVKVTEGALSDKEGCLKRAVCVMGTVPDDEMPRGSIAAGAVNFLHILQRMVTVAGMTGLTKEDLPNMRQLLASNAVGKSAGDLSLCESLFPCGVGVRHLLQEALHVAGEEEVEEAAAGKMTSCDVSGSLCPGIVVGCSVCAMFSPGVCDDTCLIAGLYCGTTGYACAIEANNNQGNGEKNQLAREESPTGAAVVSRDMAQQETKERRPN